MERLMHANLRAALERLQAAVLRGKGNPPAPDPPRLATPLDERFRRDWNGVITVNSVSDPKLFTETNQVCPAALRWLRTSYGSRGVQWEIKNFHRDTLIGFLDPHHAFEFKLYWCGR